MRERSGRGLSWPSQRAPLLDRERAGHVRVDRADKGVGAGGERRDRVVDLAGAGEEVALEGDGARGVLDLDVVRDARVVVLEVDREWPGRHGERAGGERGVGRPELDGGPGGVAGGRG